MAVLHHNMFDITTQHIRHYAPCNGSPFIETLATAPLWYDCEYVALIVVTVAWGLYPLVAGALGVKGAIGTLILTLTTRVSSDFKSHTPETRSSHDARTLGQPSKRSYR